MEKQEIFNKVAKHLLTQNKRSISLNLCMYRGENGLMCAAGCLLTDEEAEFIKEYGPWERAYQFAKYNFPRLIEDFGEHEEFIVALQRLHDKKSNLVSEWPVHLKNLAVDYKLDASVVEEFIISKTKNE